MSTILNLIVTFVLAAPVSLAPAGTDYHTQRDTIDAVSQELRNAKASGVIDRVMETTMQLCDLQTKMGCPGAALNTLRFSQRWIDNRFSKCDTMPSSLVTAKFLAFSAIEDARRSDLWLVATSKGQ